jgi:hypothetical protein
MAGAVCRTWRNPDPHRGFLGDQGYFGNSPCRVA